MTLWPAGRLDVFGRNPYRFTGSLGLLRDVPDSGSRLNPNVREGYSRFAAQPDGYSAGGAYVLPIKAGGMSSWQAGLSVSGSGDLLQGGPMEGTGAVSVSGMAGLSLIVSLAGNGVVTFTGGGGLSLTIGLAGNGALSLTGDAGLSLVVPIEGGGSFSISGAGDLRGRLGMEGSWGGAPALSPEGLAQAVWNGLAGTYSTPGTMGALVNASGAGGDPWAVTLEGPYTAADLLRIVSAVMAGDATGTNQPGTTVFRSLDGTKDRVTATQAEGTRTITGLDPS